MSYILKKTSKFYTYQYDECKPKSFTQITNDVLNKRHNFNSVAFKKAIEPFINTCRENRKLGQEKDHQRYGYYIILDICDSFFLNIIQETDIAFDTTRYPLREEFATMLNVNANELSSIHMKYNQDKGRLKNRHEKRQLMSPILDKQKRDNFHHCYLDFILNYIGPNIYTTTKCTKFYFQVFPCIRLVRPGEFSIGPHCDSAYGFNQANINYYIPLTAIYGRNSLILESFPGKEDWHEIQSIYGTIKRFWGAQCAHFTVENTTVETRISLDFRIILDQYWISDHDHFSSIPGYYTSCEYIKTTVYSHDTNVTQSYKIDNSNDDNNNDCNSDNITTNEHTANTNSHPTNTNNVHVYETECGYWKLCEQFDELPIPDFRFGFPFEKKPT